MKKIAFVSVSLFVCVFVFAQPAKENADDSWKKIYRASATKINDLVHTKLDVKFDYDKSYLYGKEWVTLKPHFYPTDSLCLDAKGMDIHKIALVKGENNISLKYDYNGMLLRIQLDRSYKNSETYTIFIDYTSKPNELKNEGSNAINDSKGLYFINPKGEEKDKPTQIWTQGESESNSAWFPTIDKPNQKTTEEIYMTVPDKYVTLSNGKLMSQKKNEDGTRTDYWKMDLPHAPYLFFMGVGDYAIVKDSYKGKEVNYYVEKEYAPVARRIFGNTPDMIAFYEKITGVEYPWVKYDQITGRDYVSGAMENTTATLHTDALQQDARELVDGNKYEDYVAHELFHQWFGDLVTTESWSNITLNESFADYSETLWFEHKYGKDAGDEINYKGIQSYLADPTDPSKNLVRFYYADKEDVFDMVSYAKGGRILNMLRNYVGDSAFFKALNLYLVTNKFKSAEAQQLRLAFEEVTGQDLNWFWNEWYYSNGHPKLNIDYLYDDDAKKVNVVINQTQAGDKVFKLPIAIDIYNGSQKYRHKVWIENKSDTFTFAYNIKPDLINVDGDKVLLCEKKDNKTLDNYIHQYKYAGLYLDRREAIDYCAKHQEDDKAVDLLKLALKDKFPGLRVYVLEKLDFKKDNIRSTFEPLILDVAKNDAKSLVRAKAIELLGSFQNPDYKPLFEKAISDSSYSVSGDALEALNKIDSTEAIKAANSFVKFPARGKLLDVICAISTSEDVVDKVMASFESLPTLSEKKLETAVTLGEKLALTTDSTKLKKGVDLLIDYRESIPAAYRSQTDVFINKIVLEELLKRKQIAGLTEQADYIKSKLDKKAF
ncbi:MAG: M1 family metallopeptidase [Bacteroidetes bacterium]|nr:M1 family metallopeptidase [Bacteroidota bacterium]